MKRNALIGLLLLALSSQNALGQALNARRMAMGGVVLPGAGGEASNVAYRGVPIAPGSNSDVALPIGLIPLIANPPVIDPHDPDFNIYELANTVYNPPWNLQLVSPEPPSSDILVELGRDHLAVELGEIGRLFPEDRSRVGAVTQGPSLGFGFRRFFAGASAVVAYRNDLALNQPLHGALADGQPFQTRTEYALYDDGMGEAAAMLQAGWAGAVMKTGDPRTRAASALYAGVRAKLLRGLAYADAENRIAFTTTDTLFSSAPIDLDYSGFIRKAGPSGGGWGQGLDLGVVWLLGDLEVGVGVNDLVNRIDWKVEESVALRDSIVGDFARVITGQDVPFTSRIPATGTVNVSTKLGGFLVAADVMRSLGNTTGHLGVETWLGMLALRSGAHVDANRQLQFGGGAGLKLGRFGLDLGLATNSRNLSRERGLELGAGLALYR